MNTTQPADIAARLRRTQELLERSEVPFYAACQELKDIIRQLNQKGGEPCATPTFPESICPDASASSAKTVASSGAGPKSDPSDSAKESLPGMSDALGMMELSEAFAASSDETAVDPVNPVGWEQVAPHYDVEVQERERAEQAANDPWKNLRKPPTPTPSPDVARERAVMAKEAAEQFEPFTQNHDPSFQKWSRECYCHGFIDGHYRATEAQAQQIAELGARLLTLTRTRERELDQSLQKLAAKDAEIADWKAGSKVEADAGDEARKEAAELRRQNAVLTESDNALGEIHRRCTDAGIECGHVVERVEGLVAQLSRQRERIAKETRYRVYYQDVVYAICNLLDKANGHTPGHGIVCGSADSPTTEVKVSVRSLIDERDNLRAEVLGLKGHSEGLQAIFESGQKHASELAAEFPGVDWNDVDDFVPHVRKLRADNAALSAAWRQAREALSENELKWTERECLCDPKLTGTRCHRCHCLALTRPLLSLTPPDALRPVVEALESIANDVAASPDYPPPNLVEVLRDIARDALRSLGES